MSKTKKFSRGKEDNGIEHQAIPWQEICQIKSRAKVNMIDKLYHKYDYHLSRTSSEELLLGGTMHRHSWSYPQNKSIWQKMVIKDHAYIEILGGFKKLSDHARLYLEEIGFSNNTY